MISTLTPLPHRPVVALTVAAFCAVALLPVPLAGGNDRLAQVRTPSFSMPLQDSGNSEAASDDDTIQGFTEPYADINMAAAEMGTLAAVLVKEGHVVKAGDLLARLDDEVLQASLEVAAAGMEAKGELESATTSLELKKIEQQKLTELFGRQHASQQELDRVRGEVKIASAKLQSVTEELDIRRLEHARIQAQLNQRQIRSTIDGVVIDVRKDKGEFVSPSDPVVVRVVQLDPLLVVFSVPVAKRDQVKAGQTVAMAVGEAGAAAQGEVEFVSPTADPSSGSFRLKVRLPNADGQWHGGEKAILLLDKVLPSQPPAKQLAKQTR